MKLILEECLTIKLREVKQRAEDDNAANNSMDVRAKQRLCYQRVFLTRSCVVAVSPHVSSAVRPRLLFPALSATPRTSPSPLL
jgi:hypothetical protein